MAKKLERELERVDKKRQEILDAINERNRGMRIKCCSCKGSHAIGSLTLIQTHFHVSPSGCSGGDYWSEGEIQYVCPTNDVVNRLLFNNDDVPWEDRRKPEYDPQAQFKERYGPSFRGTEDVYDDERSSKPQVNNDYVDRNRAKFGLVARSK